MACCCCVRPSIPPFLLRLRWLHFCFGSTTTAAAASASTAAAAAATIRPSVHAGAASGPTIRPQIFVTNFTPMKGATATPKNGTAHDISLTIKPAPQAAGATASVRAMTSERSA